MDAGNLTSSHGSMTQEPEQDAAANDCPAGCFGEVGDVGWVVMAELGVLTRNHRA